MNKMKLQGSHLNNRNRLDLNPANSVYPADAPQRLGGPSKKRKRDGTMSMDKNDYGKSAFIPDFPP